MSRIVLSAQKLLEVPVETLWETLSGEFDIQFEDGILENVSEGTTIYSAYIWEFMRRFPGMPILKRHHLNSVIGNKWVSVDNTNKLLGNVVWDLYDFVVYGIDPRDEDNKNRTQNPMFARIDPIEFKETLASLVWETINKMYNDLSVRCSEWILGISIEDLVEIVTYPPIKALLDAAPLMPTQNMIDDIYAKLKDVFYNDPAIAHNALTKLVKSETINEGQLYQCVGVRGFITDIDSRLFNPPIMRNLTQGIISAYDSQIESRSAAKALAYSEEPLEQSEYYSRRQQQISQILRNLHETDCGTTNGTSWLVDEEDLKHLEGKNYYDAQGVLRYVKSTDKHLVGKTIKMRSVFNCEHPDPYGVCSVCFGQLSLAVFKESSLGQDTAVSMLSDIGQKVLSTKHLDGTSKIDSVEIDLASKHYLRVGRDGSSYVLSPDLKNATKILLVFEPHTVPGFTDIKSCRTTAELFLSRVSRMNKVGIIVTERNRETAVEVEIGLKKRPASLSFDIINLIRERGWSVNDNGDYVVDITGVEVNSKIFTVPLRHFNMGDQAKAIAALLESRTEDIKVRDEETSVTEFISELYETVNSKLSVNYAVLEAITYSTMIVSAKEEDYSLPKPWTEQGLGVKNRTFRRRSASAEMAYQGQQDAILDPIRYNLTNVPDHQMDVFIDPAGVIAHIQNKS